MASLLPENRPHQAATGIARTHRQQTPWWCLHRRSSDGIYFQLDQPVAKGMVWPLAANACLRSHVAKPLSVRI